MYFTFSIRNCCCRKKDFKSYFYFHKQLTTYKDFEIECVDDNWNIFSIEFKKGFKEDHAGIRFAISLLGKELYLQLVDIRHWDYTNNCWQELPEKKKLTFIT